MANRDPEPECIRYFGVDTVSGKTAESAPKPFKGVASYLAESLNDEERAAAEGINLTPTTPLSEVKAAAEKLLDSGTIPTKK